MEISKALWSRKKVSNFHKSFILPFLKPCHDVFSDVLNLVVLLKHHEPSFLLLYLFRVIFLQYIPSDPSFPFINLKYSIEYILFDITPPYH